MEIDDQNAPTYEQRMEGLAQRRTEAAESLRQIAVGWTCLAAIAAVLWLIVLIAS